MLIGCTSNENQEVIKNSSIVYKRLTFQKVKESKNRSELDSIALLINYSNFDSLEFYKLKFICYELMGNEKKGIDFLNNAIRLDSLDFFSNYSVASFYYKQNNFNSAIIFLRRIVENNKDQGFLIEYNPAYLNDREKLFSISNNQLIYMYAVSLYYVGYLNEAKWYFHLLESYNYFPDSVRSYLSKIQ
jgi:tetratricopeptide (TPR) repeat protein